MKNLLAIASLLSLVLILPSAQGQSSHAFLWTATGGMQDLGTLGGTFSQAYGINASGEVVGYSSLAGDSVYHAFLWTASGGMQDLGSLGGTNSEALAINTRGQIVGYTTSKSGGNTIYHAFLWTSGVVRHLGTLGGASSIANSINDSGVVAGYSNLSANKSDAFVWTLSSGMQDLGRLAGSWSAAFGINNSGEVAGEAPTRATEDPISWTATGGMKDLLPHHHYIWGSGNAINRYGNIVGAVQTAPSFPQSIYAALWTSRGMKRLPTLGGAVSVAIGISGNNQVVGYSGTTTANVKHAFLWTQAGGLWTWEPLAAQTARLTASTAQAMSWGTRTCLELATPIRGWAAGKTISHHQLSWWSRESLRPRTVL